MTAGQTAQPTSIEQSNAAGKSSELDGANYAPIIPVPRNGIDGLSLQKDGGVSFIIIAVLTPGWPAGVGCMEQAAPNKQQEEEAHVYGLAATKRAAGRRRCSGPGIADFWLGGGRLGR